MFTLPPILSFHCELDFPVLNFSLSLTILLLFVLSSSTAAALVVMVMLGLAVPLGYLLVRVPERWR